MQISDIKKGSIIYYFYYSDYDFKFRIEKYKIISIKESLISGIFYTNCFDENGVICRYNFDEEKIFLTKEDVLKRLESIVDSEKRRLAFEFLKIDKQFKKVQEELSCF
jgi:hypothetical protein